MEKLSLSELWEDKETCEKIARAWILFPQKIRSARHSWSENEEPITMITFNDEYTSYHVQIRDNGLAYEPVLGVPFWKLTQILTSAGYYIE